MNESEIPSEFGHDSGIETLRNEVQSLRALLSCSILLLVVFSVCVNIFMMRQAMSARAQAVQAERVLANYQNGGVAQAIEFWTRLNDYARTHPDFAPVINKYSQFITVHTNATPPAAVKK